MALIEREALENKRMEMPLNPGYVDVVSWEAIQSAPIIEAAPVVHGSWEEVDWVEPDGHGFGTVRVPKAGLMCNQCANVFKKKLLWKDNYCPNCGCKMNGGEGHG